MLYFLFRIVAFGKSSMLLIYGVFFYPFRFISLNGGHWPLPDYQTFHYPGIPSILVPYDQTNDFYFSGHTGLCTILLFMFILHFDEDEDYSSKPLYVGDDETTASSTQNLINQFQSKEIESKKPKTLWHKVFIVYGGIVLFVTLYMLTVTRGHYFNDLLIGFIVALSGIYYGYKVRFTLSYWVIWGYAKLFNLLICSRFTENSEESSKKVHLISEEREKSEESV